MALLLSTRGGATAAPSPLPPAALPAPAAAPGGLLRGLSRLSALPLRRGGARAGAGAGAARGAYSALARDSTESLPRAELPKSRSAHAMEPRQQGGGASPRAADEAERRGELPREPASVPDFGDALRADRAPRDTKLVFLDSSEEEEPVETSEYESEGRLSLGFCNPHYLCGEARALQARLTPDSGVELVELRPRPPAAPAAPGPARRALLVAGGREAARPALAGRALPLWLYPLP